MIFSAANTNPSLKRGATICKFTGAPTYALGSSNHDLVRRGAPPVQTCGNVHRLRLYESSGPNELKFESIRSTPGSTTSPVGNTAPGQSSRFHIAVYLEQLSHLRLGEAYPMKNVAHPQYLAVSCRGATPGYAGDNNTSMFCSRQYCRYACRKESRLWCNYIRFMSLKTSFRKNTVLLPRPGLH